MARAKVMLAAMGSGSYPQAQKLRVGCKVSWYYYTDLKDARKASKVAEKEAVHLAQQGFDFGFQCPGQVHGPIQEGEYQGMYSVVIP